MRCKPSSAQRLLRIQEMLGCSCICALPKKGKFERNFCFVDPAAEREFSLQQELLENTFSEQFPKGHWQQIIPFLALDNL